MARSCRQVRIAAPRCPARAGMAPSESPTRASWWWCPRPRGDGPVTERNGLGRRTVPPPARGWLDSARQQVLVQDGAPARAGMARSRGRHQCRVIRCPARPAASFGTEIAEQAQIVAGKAPLRLIRPRAGIAAHKRRRDCQAIGAAAAGNAAVACVTRPTDHRDESRRRTPISRIGLALILRKPPFKWVMPLNSSALKILAPRPAAISHACKSCCGLLSSGLHDGGKHAWRIPRE